MKNQTSGYRLARQNAGRLAGVFGLLLALCLITGGVVPAYAQPPTPPHQFYGTVTVGDPPAAVTVGTAVEAYANGVKKAETVVDGEGRYGYAPTFKVPGTAGATVTFRVGGVLANETAIWQSGAMTNLDLTIAAPPPVQYDLTVDSTIGGSVTDPGEGTFTYPQGTVVDLLAVPDAGYQFVNWTGNTGSIDDVNAADTFITTNGNYAITANFGLIWPEQRLLGTGAEGMCTGSPAIVRMLRFSALATGTITKIRVYALTNGNVRVALYADNAGEPGALLSAKNTSTYCTANQWNSITLPGAPVIGGTAYWIAVADESGAGACYCYANPIPMRHKLITYSSYTFPNPAGSDYIPTSHYYAAFDGWGITTVAPEPPAAPTRDCSALTFRWNASAGATNYHLQVNTSADFTGTDVFNGEVGNVTSREVTDLTSGTIYYYRVKAGNAAGWSGWSSTGSVRCGGVI